MTHYAPRITSPARAARPRTRRIHPLTATLVLATAALLATPDTAQAQACPAPTLTGRQQIWTGTVTVGTRIAGGRTSYYGFEATTDPTTGALSDTMFDIGSNSHTIVRIFVDADGDVGALVFGLSSSLTTIEVASLRLHVCGVDYDFADATTFGTQPTYYWDSAGLDWSSVTSRTLCLSVPAAAASTPAAGAPTITGRAKVGQTLTAVTTGISDPDGLTSPTYTYQWIRVDTDSTETDISGATSDLYYPVAADLGTTIKVKVSFTDDASNAETLTSAATASISPNNPATGASTITGTAQVGETLTAVTTGIMDADGLASVSYTYQWIRVDSGTDADISGATSSTYTLVAADEGTTIKVKVSFTDDASNAETRTSVATGTVAAAANNPATGVPTITGTARVGETLTAVTTGIMDADGLASVSYTYQWIRVDSGTDADIAGATASTYTLVAADEGTTIKVKVSFTDDNSNAETRTSVATGTVAEAQGDPEEPCPGGGYNPTPVAVAVTAVPIVVASTTADYFVLYVRHTVGETTTVEVPVLVTLGKAGTTTLAENVEALPGERYRVEKYLIADPADVDGDCVDDITELGDPVGMNPVNPAPAIAFSDGAVAIPDRETFETLAFHQETVKFVLIGMDTDRPGVYFSATDTHRGHPSFLDAVGIDRDQSGLVTGWIVHDSKLVAPDGSQGVYYYQLLPRNTGAGFSLLSRSYTLLAASMPLLDENLALHISNDELRSLRSSLSLYRESRIALVFDDDVLRGADFLALNPGEGFGLLRSLDPDERPTPRDVVIYETLPNNLPRVAGIISTVPQTPLSHVNLRAVQDGIPNAFIRNALEDTDIEPLIGSYVHYTVTQQLRPLLAGSPPGPPDGWALRAATLAQVEAHYAASRPSQAQTPEFDLSVTGIKPLSEIGFEDWKAFGVKAANVAVLGTLGFPAGTVPAGFAIPFYFYDEFMKHNDFYTRIDTMLADPDFQSKFDTQDDMLDDLRDDIKDAETPPWIIAAIVEMNEGFSEGINRRYRSSTNNEDLPGFNGAGLYDSKSQKPSEDEDDLAKSLKEVYASLWNFRAFIERDFHRIDHKAAAMGVLVHPSYQDELANGVAVSFDPIYGGDERYYVNTQLGEDLVTNPDAQSVPEEILLHRSGGNYSVLATSNQVPPGQLLMRNSQLNQLADRLTVIHDHFKALYNPAPDEPFAMEIEFKITSEDILAIKQARPWVFDNARDAPSPPPPPPANTPATGAPTITGTARVGETLTAATTGIMDADGLTSPSYAYQWIRVTSGTDADISGATSSTYTLVAADADTTIKVKVSFEDDASNAETRTSAATATVVAANTPATGAPTITGTARVDEALTAVTTGIMDADGLTSPTYTYQWIRVDSGTDADIAGATSSTYTLVAADLGTTIKVKVSFTDDDGDAETRTSAATATVAATNSPATGAPTITGTARVDETLTAATTGISDADGLTSPTYTYQWIRVETDSTETDISGATSSTYTLVAADLGKTLKVKVTFTDDASNSETRTSAATAVVAAAAATPTISAVAVTSTPQLETDTYGEGEEIQFTVTFSEAVTVTGMPQCVFSLGNAGDTRRVNAGYDAAASTDTELVFAYTVVSTDEDDNGIFILDDATVSGTAGSGSIVLGLDGSIVGKTSEVPASLAHSVRGAQSGHKVDGVRPSFLSAAVDGASLTLTYDEPLDGSSTPDAGDFTVSGGDYTRTVTRVSVSGSTVALTLNVGAEHLETGIQVSYTPGMERKRLRDVPGNEALGLSREPVTNDTPDTTSPTVSSLVITSNPGGDQIYAAGDEIELTVTFSETVVVTGTLRLRLRVGSRTRTAVYLRGTDTAAVVFGYEVAEGDEDTDGVSMEANSLTLNVGTIRDGADNNALLSHDGLAADARHKVDGVRPSFLSAAVDGASLTLTYGEGLDEGSRPASGDFTVEVDGSGRSVSGVSVSGSVVTLTLDPAVEHGDTGIRVSYTVPTGAGANPIQDAVGNDARGLNNQSVTNTTGAPNTGPEITTRGPLSVGENQALVRRLAARDTDPGDEVTGWEIVGGADQSQFSIASDTGELSFQTPPDYEDPTDEASTDPPSGAGDNEYLVRVEVRSGAGARELEVEQTFTIRVTDEREPPEVPEAPVISGETADSLTVSWSEPENTGPPITDYDVQYREKGMGRFIDGDQQGPGRTLTLSDLEPGTVYEVQVRATNDEGTSDWSESGEGMTITPLTVGMTSGTEPPVSGPFTVRFSFSEPVTGFGGSDVETGQDPACVDDQNNTVFCDPGIGALQTADDRVFITTVTPGTDRVAHSYTLTLTVPGGAVRSSVGSKPNEDPEEPLEVRVSPPGVEEPISSLGLTTSGGNGTVRLSWNLPSDNGGSAIIRYEYRFAPAGEGWSEWENVGAGTSGVMVGNLINGREYVFEVRAVNALGKGGAETVQATPERRITPRSPPPGGGGGGGGGGGLLFPPGAPASLMAMAGEGAVRLEWTPPESDGGTPILRYEYRLKEGRGEFGEWTPIEDSAPDEVNAAGYTVGGLGNGTVYVFELRAVNAAGAGQVSEAVEVRMPLDPAYWSNFRAGDLEGAQLMLEAFLSGGSGDREVRFGEGLRFEEDELDGEGEVTATRMGGYGYRYTSRTTGVLSLDHDGGEACEVRLTFTEEGAGSYVYRCGGTLVGQGSFELSELVNRVPEITSVGPFEVEENTTRVGRLEAVDWDEEDDIVGYGIARGADGALFTVEAETGELMFREAPDYETPGDVASEDPESPAADNEYIVVVEVSSGEAERERRREQTIRVRVSDVEMEEAGEEPAGEDPSDFTAGDLEGERLTLRLTGEEGTARSLELRFGAGNRFEQIESGGQQAATRSEGASRSGTYTYEKTGPGMGRLTLDYDDGASCEVLLTFTESGLGAFVYDCGDPDPAEGNFRLTTGSLFVPVILSSAGRNQSFFTSELTLTNRGDRDTKLDYSYRADRGGGSGRASEVLGAGMQKIATDALTYLRGLGIAIPETGNRIGTLRVEVPLGSEVEAVVRTTTLVPEGRAGLAYLGVAEEEGFNEAVYLCGLRQNAQDRSNVAFQNMGAPGEGAITLKTTVYSGEAGGADPWELEEELGPGEFHQYSGVLGTVENGYVKVERVEGEAPFYAYGVINDQANSDGSFVFPVAASWLEGVAGQTLPVIVETSEFQSELTVTNFSREPRILNFQFVSQHIKGDGKTVGFSMKLEAGQQEIIPEVVAALRREGMAGLGTSRGSYLGPLFVEAEDGDLSGIVIGARTGSEGGGGQYSVFYNAVPEGEAFTKEAWVEGLQRNEENRSNLALVNTGEVDGSPSVFHLEIYDGETGLLAETVVTKPIPARGWHQINGILGSYAPETRQGYIRIEKVSGANPFLAYGVVNDGGAPGERSGDGAYLPARE